MTLACSTKVPVSTTDECCQRTTVSATGQIYTDRRSNLHGETFVSGLQYSSVGIQLLNSKSHSQTMFHTCFLENLYCYCWVTSLFSSKHLLNLLPNLVPYSLTSSLQNRWRIRPIL